MTAAAGSPLAVTAGTRPRMPRHVKLRHDRVRQRWVILAPERVLVPDETAVEILRMCDGSASVGEIVDTLAEKYAADRAVIEEDVLAMLRDLVRDGFLVDGARPGGAA